MARTLRPSMPGVVFHLTARIQCRAPLLTGIEGDVVTLILAAGSRSDGRIIAYAVMPNHLHILLQQGSRPLSHYMQPLLRRVALLVRRVHGWEGHVFERRYRESACLSADHLRNAIAYVHLNGYRATLASSVTAYAWCSQHRFCDTEASDLFTRAAMEDAMRIFAPSCGADLTLCRDNYHNFVAWRVAMDAHVSQSGELCGFHPPSPPLLRGGDEFWRRVYAPYVQAEGESRRCAPRRMDLRDLALMVMRDVDPGMRLDDLREGGCTRALVDARRMVIRRALAAGYTGRAVACFLSVSPATISYVRHSA